MFEFDGDVGVGKKIGSEFDDSGEFASLDAVVVVVGGPNLEEAGFETVFFATTVQEGTGEVTDFSNMEMGGGGGAIGQG